MSQVHLRTQSVLLPPPPTEKTPQPRRQCFSSAGPDWLLGDYQIIIGKPTLGSWEASFMLGFVFAFWVLPEYNFWVRFSPSLELMGFRLCRDFA